MIKYLIPHLILLAISGLFLLHLTHPLILVIILISTGVILLFWVMIEIIRVSNEIYNWSINTLLTAGFNKVEIGFIIIKHLCYNILCSSLYFLFDEFNICF